VTLLADMLELNRLMLITDRNFGYVIYPGRPGWHRVRLEIIAPAQPARLPGDANG
jgi:hypothetical protein